MLSEIWDLPSTELVHVNTANSENTSVAMAWSQTDMTVLPFRYVWTINNFRYLWYEMGERLESPAFAVLEGNNEIKWCLLITAKTMEGNYKDFVSVHLKLVSVSNKSTAPLAKLKLAILNSKKELVNCKGPTGLHEFVEGNTPATWGYRDFINANFLFDEANADLLPKGKLTIVCDGSVMVKRVDISGKINNAKFKLPECRELSDDLGALLDQEKLSDVIISVCGHEFKAHKAILTSRSTVFAAMFEHEMEESKQNKVEITDMDAEVCKEMLRYIYTDAVCNIDRIAGDLLSAADKYALERLRVMCEESLCEQLSTENAVEILQLADLHSASQLKEKAIYFIMLNMVEVTKTSGWKSMLESAPRLADEVFSSVSELFSVVSIKDST